MNTYMILFNWTEQGIRTVREAGPRLDGLKRTLRELGGNVESFYLTMGPYDTVAIVTLPDDATMAKLALSPGPPDPRDPRRSRPAAAEILIVAASVTWRTISPAA